MKSGILCHWRPFQIFRFQFHAVGSSAVMCACTCEVGHLQVPLLKCDVNHINSSNHGNINKNNNKSNKRKHSNQFLRFMKCS
jgi:hypothetical protein